MESNAGAVCLRPSSSSPREIYFAMNYYLNILPSLDFQLFAI